MRKLFALLSILLILIIATPALAQTATPTATVSSAGVISGTLVNKTAGATDSLANLALTLHAYQGSAELNTQSAQSDASGKFSFSGLSTDPSITYGIAAVYKNTTYYSDAITFAAGESTKDAELDVYETTSSADSVSLSSVHAILHFEANVLYVKEIYLVANAGDRTYIGQPLAANGGNITTLTFTLPPGASNFQSAFGLEAYNLTTGNQIYSSDPVPPPGVQVAYAYNLACNSNTYSFPLKLNQKVSRYDILTSDPGMKISGAGITQQPSLNISGTNYQDYSLSNLEAGASVTVQLSNLSGAAAQPASKVNYFYLWFLLLIPAGAIAFFLVRRLRPARVAVDSEREQLLAEIAQLDDDFEAGRIDETVYRRLRAEKKRQLTGGGG